MPKNIRKRAKRMHVITIIVGAMFAFGVLILAHQYHHYQTLITHNRQVIEAIHLLALELSQMTVSENKFLLNKSLSSSEHLISLQNHNLLVRQRAKELSSLTFYDVYLRQNAREIESQIQYINLQGKLIWEAGYSFTQEDLEKRAAVVGNVIELSKGSEIAVRNQIESYEKKLFSVQGILVSLFMSSLVLSFFLTFWGEKLYEKYAEMREVSNLELERSVISRTIELEHAVNDLKSSKADLERVIYSVSHELQEPMRLMSGYVSLLAREYSGNLDPKADQYIAFAVNNAQRMQDQINDLLNFSMLSQTMCSFSKTSLNRPAKNAKKYLETMIREYGASIEINELASVVADEYQVERIFRALFSNAMKFRHPDRPVHIRVESVIQDMECVISVIDNGIGFEQRHSESIFEIFGRLHPRGKFPGTGVGLAIARKIVEMHDGRIWVESTHHVGSRFSFVLPLEGPKAQSWDPGMNEKLRKLDGTIFPAIGDSSRG